MRFIFFIILLLVININANEDIILTRSTNYKQEKIVYKTLTSNLKNYPVWNSENPPLSLGSASTILKNHLSNSKNLNEDFSIHSIQFSHIIYNEDKKWFYYFIIKNNQEFKGYVVLMNNKIVEGINEIQ